MGTSSCLFNQAGFKHVGRRFSYAEARLLLGAFLGRFLFGLDLARETSSVYACLLVERNVLVIRTLFEGVSLSFIVVIAAVYAREDDFVSG